MLIDGALRFLISCSSVLSLPPSLSLTLCPFVVKNLCFFALHESFRLRLAFSTSLVLFAIRRAHIAPLIIELVVVVVVLTSPPAIGTGVLVLRARGEAARSIPISIIESRGAPRGARRVPRSAGTRFFPVGSFGAYYRSRARACA